MSARVFYGDKGGLLMWILKPGHWTITEGVCCAVCGVAFAAGDTTELHNEKPDPDDPRIVGSAQLRHVECSPMAELHRIAEENRKADEGKKV